MRFAAFATGKRAGVSFFLALDSVHGVCGTCDRAACSGACLFALGYVHGVRVWHVRQGSVQRCVFFGT